jgi:hypothetical protein
MVSGTEWCFVTRRVRGRLHPRSRRPSWPGSQQRHQDTHASVTGTDVRLTWGLLAPSGRCVHVEQERERLGERDEHLSSTAHDEVLQSRTRRPRYGSAGSDSARQKKRCTQSDSAFESVHVATRTRPAVLIFAARCELAPWAAFDTAAQTLPRRRRTSRSDRLGRSCDGIFRSGRCAAASSSGVASFSSAIFAEGPTGPWASRFASLDAGCSGSTLGRHLQDARPTPQ